MTEPDMTTTRCKGCGRIVYLAHVDARGNCCFCEKPEPKPDPTRGPKIGPMPEPPDGNA